MDENVEGQIVRGLRARGVDVVTAEEDGRGETPDPSLGECIEDLEYLAQAGSAEDFVGGVYFPPL